MAIDVPLIFTAAHMFPESVRYALSMESPGATKSGLTRPSNVGPPDEKTAMFSCLGESVSVVSISLADKVVAGSSFTIASSSWPSFKGMPRTGIETENSPSYSESHGTVNGVP